MVLRLTTVARIRDLLTYIVQKAHAHLLSLQDSEDYTDFKKCKNVKKKEWEKIDSLGKLWDCCLLCQIISDYPGNTVYTPPNLVSAVILAILSLADWSATNLNNTGIYESFNYDLFNGDHSELLKHMEAIKPTPPILKEFTKNKWLHEFATWDKSPEKDVSDLLPIPASEDTVQKATLVCQHLQGTGAGPDIFACLAELKPNHVADAPVSHSDYEKFLRQVLTIEADGDEQQGGNEDEIYDGEGQGDEQDFQIRYEETIFPFNCKSTLYTKLNTLYNHILSRMHQLPMLI